MAAKVLVIDAEPVVRSIVAAIIQKDGYVVVQADNPMVALEILKAEPPALIITNVYLPGMTGHEAMRVFKEQCPAVPILMVSGLPDAQAIQDWKNEAGFGIFPKPFLPDDLRKKVRAMIDGKDGAA